MDGGGDHEAPPLEDDGSAADGFGWAAISLWMCGYREPAPALVGLMLVCIKAAPKDSAGFFSEGCVKVQGAEDQCIVLHLLEKLLWHEMVFSTETPPIGQCAESERIWSSQPKQGYLYQISSRKTTEELAERL